MGKIRFLPAIYILTLIDTDLTHLKRLRQEPLYLPSSRYGHLVVLRQFIHAQNGDDVLK